jgi:hypothetical protein
MSRPGDGQGAAWAGLTERLADELPGTWERSGGRPGLRTVLVRVPVGWLVPWVGVDRVRAGDPLRVLAGVVPLVEPVASLHHRWGLASDLSPWRAWFDLTTPDGAEELRSFVVEHAIPKLDSYSPAMLAASAEAALAEPDPARRFATVTQAAGWRVVDGSGSPVEPARVAAERFADLDMPENVTWYEGLADAYGQGGRNTALDWLRDRRTRVLDRLKLLPSPAA